jgi:hypothetical protein
MKSAFLALFVVGFAAVFGQAYAAEQKPGSAKPSAKAPAPNDPTALSSGFWTDWKQTKSSPSFSALSSAADCGCGPAPQGAEGQAQARGPSTVDVAITKPAEAAEFLSKSLASSNDPVTDGALATVVNMRMSPEVRQAAEPLVAPQAQTRVEQFRANLSTGIPGLPGIYLGDNSGSNSGSGSERPSLPTGYTPVAGPSVGCPSRN